MSTDDNEQANKVYQTNIRPSDINLLYCILSLIAINLVIHKRENTQRYINTHILVWTHLRQLDNNMRASECHSPNTAEDIAWDLRFALLYEYVSCAVAVVGTGAETARPGPARLPQRPEPFPDANKCRESIDHWIHPQSHADIDHPWRCQHSADLLIILEEQFSASMYSYTTFGRAALLFRCISLFCLPVSCCQ